MAALSNVETGVVQIASGPGGRGKRLHLERVAPSIAPRASAEERFWKGFCFPVLLKQFGAVTRCEFSPAAPFDLAATSGSEITLVQSQSKEVKRSLTRFKSTPYSGSYRHDGQLLVAGGATPVVQVFDAESRNVLRKFGGSKTAAAAAGHKAAVHVARFGLSLPHVFSGGDDRLALLWDLETGDQTPLATFSQHTDYIRCAANSPSSPHTWLTGAYDHTVRLWDGRAARSQTMCIDHGAPVEDLLLFPGGTTLITAGGPLVRIWDLLAGGRLIKTLANHQKAVTCLAFDATHTRLLTGSIDRFVKIYDLNTIADDASSSSSSSTSSSSSPAAAASASAALTSAYTVAATGRASSTTAPSSQVLHSLRYPAPVLSLALSPDDQHLAVGMSDGVLSIRTRPSTASTASVSSQQRKVALKFHALGQHSITTGGQQQQRGGFDNADYLVGQRYISKKLRPRIKPYERMLNKFQYYEALNAALATNNSLVVLSLMKELLRRNSLKLALSGRDEADLLPLLRFIARFVRNPRFARFINRVFALLLDIYSPVVGQSKEAELLLLEIQTKMHAELHLQSEILKLMGVLDLYLATM